MKVQVKKTKQFPKGVIDLRDLQGGETILMDAGLAQIVWLGGQATGEERLFGTMQIRAGQGPYGFGFEVGRSAGDAPLIVQTADSLDLEADDASVYELTELGAIGVWKRSKSRSSRRKSPWTGPREWTPE